MIKSIFKIGLAALAAVALLAPVAAQAKREHVRKPHNVSFVFKGTLASVDGEAKSIVVAVKGGNRHARRYRGKDVAFDLSRARIVIRDRNGDGERNLADAAAGDRVSVVVRMPRKSDASERLKAKGFVDKARGPRVTSRSRPLVP
jgi:hypothetical protein